MTARPGRLHVIIESTTLVYDSDGALRSFTRTGADAVSVTYDQDAVGRSIARRVGGSVMARGTYHGTPPVAEYDGGWGLQRVFVYGTRGHVPDYVLAIEGGTWVPYRVVTDHLGSVRRVVRVSDGAVVQRMSYDAYGRVLVDEVASAWSALPFGYAGGIYDRGTKLVRFGARDYDAEIGRWTAKDPIGFGGGDGNLYGYVSSNPTNYVDPSGYFHPAILLAIILAIPLIEEMDYDAGPINANERIRNAIWLPPNTHGTNDDVNANFYHCMAFCESRASDALGGIPATVLLAGDLAWENVDADDAASSTCGHNLGASVGDPSECYQQCGSTFGTNYVGQMERLYRPHRAGEVVWPTPQDPRNSNYFLGGSYRSNLYRLLFE